jgi:uncharacterized protein (TIGR03643 family)
MKADTDELIDTWPGDETLFEAIKLQFSLSEDSIIQLMRRELKFSSF